MAGLVRASMMQQPAFLSPHRKRRWRQHHMSFDLTPRATMYSSSPSCRMNRENHWNSCSIRIGPGNDGSVGWKFCEANASFGLHKSRVALCANARNWLHSVALETQLDMNAIQSPTLEPVHVEIVNSAPHSGADLFTLGQALLNLLLETHPISNFSLVVTLTVLIGGIMAYVANVETGEGVMFEKLDKILEIEDCVFISHPSPFNRFVAGRCPSIASASARLVFENNGEVESRPVYQRQCLHAIDGGVVTIDWPAELEITGADGLDNVLLLISGTTEGSGDEGIQKFVMDAMRLGYFPIVLNPRGCAGSPLTTPRMFTAADSDDVRLAVQHIARAQPRSTLMGIGWGFGANMLAKYLGEEAGTATLMAAVCISNPFDLEESLRHLSRAKGGELDRAMTKGLVNILETNKMLFVGEKKGFDLGKGLAATSMGEFDSAISRVAYGYETLEDFYGHANSAGSISNLQVPVLFVQGEDDTMPLFTIPRQVIEQNPYATALVAQSSQSTTAPTSMPAVLPGSAARLQWSHAVALEWIAAVEVALLKGRHPLLDSFNLSIRPNDERNLTPKQQLVPNVQPHEEKEIEVSSPSGRELDVEMQFNDDSGPKYDEDNGTVHSKNKEDPLGQENLVVEGNGNSKDSKLEEPEHKGTIEDQVTPVAEEKKENGVAAPEEEAPRPPEEGEPEEGSEAFQMRAAAESIMNVLDVTMPGTLADEQKAQVLSAVGRGESVIQALQEAVPEEVRGSLATAVSGAVQARGMSFNLVGFGKHMPPPSLPAGLTDSIKDRLAAVAGGKQDAVSGPSPVPLPELQPTSSVDQNKQTQEVPAPGMLSSDSQENQGSESGNSSVEKSNPEDTKSETQSQLDISNSKPTPGGGGEGEANANMDRADAKTEKSDDEGDKGRTAQGSKEADVNGPKSDNNAKQTEDKDKSDERVNLEEHKSSEKSDSSEEAANKGADKVEETKGELVDSKQSSPDNPKDGKNEEQTGRREKVQAEQKGAENKDSEEGAREVSINSESQKEQKKPEEAVDEKDNVQKAKQEGNSEVDGQLPVNPEPPAAVPVPAPVTPPGSPPPPPLPSPPKPGMAPPIDMHMAFQALTGFDDSTQMAVTNVFGVVEGVLEQLEIDQKVTAPNVSGGAKEPHGVEDKESGDKTVEGHEDATGGEESAEDTVTQAADSVPSKKEDDKMRQYDDDDDGRSSKSVETVGGQMGYVQKGELNKKRINGETEDNQKSGKTGGKESNSLCNPPPPLPSNLSREKSVHRQQSSVKVIQKVGASMRIESMVKDKSCQENGAHFGLNGAASRPELTARKEDTPSPPMIEESSDDKDVQEVATIQQRNISEEDMSVEDSRVGKAAEMTLEQLALEVDQDHQQEQKNKALRNVVGSSQSKELTVAEGKEEISSSMVHNMVKDALKLEVLRRLGVAGMEALGLDIEQEFAKVADAVAETVQKWKQEGNSSNSGSDAPGSGKLGILQGESIVSALSTVVSSTRILGGLVPIGVLAGVVLAAVGAVYLIVTNNNEVKKAEISDGNLEEEEEGQKVEEGSQEDDDPSSWQDAKASAVVIPVLSVNGRVKTNDSNVVNGAFHSEAEEERLEESSSDASDDENTEEVHEVESTVQMSDEEKNEEADGQNKLLGAMAAAVSGTAALAGLGMSHANVTSEKEGDEGGDGASMKKGEKTGREVENPSIISSFQPLAEKALSVAAPVVPTKEDGEIDHERLVAMLAELGQRGGFLRLIGKVALLWGGLRGAMSLTDRLLSILRINERPVHQRLVGFAAMIVLLWSPVLVPVLPSLLQQWATKSPSGVADAASVVGLYGACLILVTIWGKRVRGYDKPFLQYGLRLYSRRKVQDILRGIAIGSGLVTALYSTNAILGYVQFKWTGLIATNIRFPGVVALSIFTVLKVGKLVGQAIGIGLAVALVEEVLFRAWLQEELAVDLGFHKAVFLSALAFALVHWSPAAAPGLWFLSVALAGARAKTGRNLAFPIGLHSGLVSANYVVTVGGLAHFLPHAPSWFTGANVRNPLAGALGTAMMAMLAVILYPRVIATPPPMILPTNAVQKAELGAAT